MGAKLSSGEIAETIQKLKAEIAGHRATLAGIGDRRQQFAFAASQGDEEAKGELAKIEADEASATSASKNLTLALAEAEKMHAAADAREAAERDDANAEVQRVLADELIAADKAIVAAIEGLARQLDGRLALVQQIGKLGVLNEGRFQRLAAGEPLAEAIKDALGRHIDHGARPDWCRGALGRLVAIDAAALGVKVDKPEMTAVERELSRLPRRPASPPIRGDRFPLERLRG